MIETEYEKTMAEAQLNSWNLIGLGSRVRRPNPNPNRRSEPCLSKLKANGGIWMVKGIFEIQDAKDFGWGEVL